MAKKDEALIKEAQQEISALLALLQARPEHSAALLDIMDVLGQVEKKVADTINVPALVIRLVNYIHFTSLEAKIHFSSDEDQQLAGLRMIGQKAGLNSQYLADYTDKSQFYSLVEPIPKH